MRLRSIARMLSLLDSCVVLPMLCVLLCPAALSLLSDFSLAPKLTATKLSCSLAVCQPLSPCAFSVGKHVDCGALCRLYV